MPDSPKIGNMLMEIAEKADGFTLEYLGAQWPDGEWHIVLRSPKYGISHQSLRAVLARALEIVRETKP